MKVSLLGKLLQAAREGRVDDVSQLATHFTGEVESLGVALDDACRYGHLNVVTWLVENTVLRDNFWAFKEPLLSSCANAQWHVAKWLLNNIEVDVNFFDNIDKNVISTVIDDSNVRPTYKLWKAAHKGRVQDVSQFSMHFSDDVDTLGGALREACKYDQLDVVMWLVTHTVLYDEFDILGESLLLSSAYTQWHVAKWLLCIPQLDVDYTDSNKNSIISIVIDNVELLGYRLRQSARKGYVKDVSQLSIHFTNNVDALVGTLREACNYDQLDVVMWLIKHTALVDDMEACGSALTLACIKNQLTEMTWLVENTALQYSGAELGRALLAAASNHRLWNVAKWLLKTIQNIDVNINGLDNRNDTALHHVIWNRMKSSNTSKYTTLRYDCQYYMTETEMCKLVYVYGEDVNAQDDYGDTFLHIVCSSSPGNSDIVGVLLLAGADETITNDDELTSVQLASRWRSDKVLELLDVSSKWKLLVRLHRLRRRTAVRVMMTLVNWKVPLTRTL
jgi:ankyrin repeat protein